MKQIDTKNRFRYFFLAILISLFIAGCQAEKGSTGDTGATGTAGADGAGLSAENCALCHANVDGELKGEVKDAAVTKVHSKKEYPHTDGTVVYTATINDATVDGSKKVVINFQITDNQNRVSSRGDEVRYVEISDFGSVTPDSVRMNVGKLDPTTKQWKQVIYERLSEGTFAEDTTDLGTYNYTSYWAIDSDSTTDGAQAVTYDAAATYRVTLQMGGHTYPAATPFKDINGAGGTPTDTRNIVNTAACQNCHGNAFHGHGGDRTALENCVMCHNENDEPDFAMAKMAHYIHAATDDTQNDGGVDFSEVTFPQPAYECTACHAEAASTGLEDALNWQTNPTREACGSCHYSVDFATGDGHSGGIQTDDLSCGNSGSCHGTSATNAVTTVHSTANTNIINADDLALDTPVYTVEVSLVDATGDAYTATEDLTGETPYVKVVIKDGGTAIDHTTVESDFDDAEVFVYGPRSMMKPVLTEASDAGGLGYDAPNDLKDSSDSRVTVTTGYILYKLNTVPTTLTDGTYMAYVTVNKDGGDATNGYQAPSTGIANFQVGTTTVEDRVAGNCQACHGDTIMHAGISSSHRHDTIFDVQNCGACHDYTKGSTDSTVWDWFGAKPISKRVHSVHGAKKIYDQYLETHPTDSTSDAEAWVDEVVGHAPATAGEYWSEITFPSELNDCEGSCHNQDNSTAAYKEEPNQLACMGCHATDEASDHMLLMGGVAKPE